ncbi:AAA+ superfamily predicted ATPase [Desulfomicrobium macestii]|uniref:AAA+ superfamily predicted ATPase n=1 Tax=Desulfomicrobium macestii TaxID=90731 RepID=A0ABR9H575_9BACT|nr:ATP-binding protein [Desulfomicrobium macestii]MBE1425873.1 AAA+ superfamily predicted ATPase [Desulfomicrobium macestii]
MARADLLNKLIIAGVKGDQASFRSAAEAIIAEEKANKHFVLADRLAESLKISPQPRGNGFSESKNKGLFFEINPQKKLGEMILSDTVRQICDELVEEQNRREILRSYGLEPRHKVLLAGPPGNGKTSLAEAIAYSLAVPFLVVRYESLIGSFLGETSSRLKQIFEYARTTQCVLFFDEFDTIGKERGDVHETGEIKRVVSSLLLQIDALPSYVVVIAASNHQELLDKAVWRRFQVRLSLPNPTISQISEWLKRFEDEFNKPLGFKLSTLARTLQDLSFAEIEEFCSDIRRRYVLSNCQGDIKSIVGKRLEQWKHRSVVLTNLTSE